MKYIVSFQMHAVHIGNRACETLLLQSKQTENALHIKNNHQTVPKGPQANDPRR